VSKKSDLISKILGKEDLLEGLPATGLEGNLLELGLQAVLLRELSPKLAAGAVSALRDAFEDYNEARVAQVQELAEVIAPRGKGMAHLAKFTPAARLTKSYLQEVFQKTHGLELEFLNEDPVAGVRLLLQLPLVGTSVSSYLLFVAEEGEFPVTSGVVRVLDRVGVMTRSSSVRKVRESLKDLVGEDDRLPLAFILGQIVDRWCESRRPSCWECVMLDECPMGKKVHKEWKVLQERLQKQRRKEEVRRLQREKKDAERRKREAERERKRLELEEKKRERQLEREQRAAEKIAEEKRVVEEKRKAAITKEKAAAREKVAAKKAAVRKKESERKKAIASKKAAAKKKAADKKKAAAKKKAAKKKIATKTKATAKSKGKSATRKVKQKRSEPSRKSGKKTSDKG
jgi:endonuclease III